MIGLFRELDAQLSQNLNSIHDFAWGLSSDIADIIFEYLINGVPVFDVMGVTVDPFDGTIIITGGPSLVSDVNGFGVAISLILLRSTELNFLMNLLPMCCSVSQRPVIGMKF